MPVLGDSKVTQTLTEPGSKSPRGRTSSAPGWLALAGIILVAFSLRPSIVSVGPVLPAIISEFHLSHAQASLLTAIPDVMMGILALAAPILALKWGRDGVILGALLLLAVATFVRAFVTSAAMLLLVTGGVGAGIAVAGALVAGFIKERFSTRAAAVMGLYATALSIGSTVSAAATDPLATIGDSWRLSVGVWSALGVVGFLAWALLALSGKGSATPARGGKPNPLPFTNPKAWAIAVFFAMNNFLFYSILAWVATVYQEAGSSASEASFILASFTFVFMCANPLFGFLSRSEDRRGWLFVAAASAFVGLVGLALAPQWLPLLFVPVCAFGLGGTFTLGMTLPLDNTSTPAEANSWNAFVLLVGYVVAAAGPLATGYLRDMTGNFGMSLMMWTISAGVMACLSLFLKPRRR